MKSAKNDVNYYLNLLDLLEFQAFDEIETTMNRYLSERTFNTGALNMVLKGQHQLENYFVFDSPTELSYASVGLDEAALSALEATIAMHWTEDTAKMAIENLGMSLNTANGKLYLNAMLINPDVGHSYFYQFNLTNKILTSIPSDLYQNLYISLFNKKVAMDNILILRQKTFMIKDLESYIPAATEMQLQSVRDGGFVVINDATGKTVYAVLEINRENWMQPAQVLISNTYRNNEILSFFIQYVVGLTVMFLVIFTAFITLTYRILKNQIFDKIKALHENISESVKQNYLVPIDVTGAEQLSEISNDFEHIRKEMLERVKFIDEMSYFDTVTGVGNIYLLEEKLKTAYQTSETDHAHFLILFEIKNIQAQFEAYGAGKMNLVYANIIALLQSVFGREAVFRKSDYAFAVLYADADRDAVRSQIETVRRELKTLNLEVAIEPRFIVAKYPEDGETPKILLQNIDLAQQMLQDHDVVFYSQRIKDEYLDRIALENELKQALVNHEIKVVFQPVVCPNTNVIKGVETLIRWEPGSGRKVYPDMFIPVAEQLGIIHELDQFVFEKAISMLQLWSDIYPYDFFVSINSSPKWFTNPEFLNFIRTMLARYPVDPSKVCIEIIETCLIEDIDGANDLLKQMKAMGVTIALDDFGKGYSSLNYLRKLNIDKLKIDKDFLSEMVIEVGKHNLIDSIISMAHHMALEVVVEGVEVYEQVVYLKNLNVELIQGYYYSKPVDKQVISDILLNSGVMRASESTGRLESV
jgi:EAL domain-containing protein (putative c-di-GMP-specific phosphodiesterase class I)/GGDEF domain-containing protein